MTKTTEAVRQKMDDLAQRDFWKKLAAWLSVFAAICIVFPLFYYSGYNFMCLDDYSIGVQTHLAWENRAGFFSGVGDVFASVARKVGAIYMDWGGNYSSMIFTCLQPAVFNEKLAFLNTYILLGSFVAANIYLFRKLFYKSFRFSCGTVTVMASGVIILSTQWLPSAVEGFYWFNGSFYNIVGYSMGLVLAANMYETARSERKSKVFYIATVITGIFVAGTNYTIMLFLMLLGFLFMLGLIFTGCPVKQRNRCIIMYLIFVIFCFINICAPGNTVRQGSFVRMSALSSVYYALMEGRELYLGGMNARIWIFFVVLLPFLLSDLRKIKFRFQYPLAFTVIVYLLFSAMFTPTLCALYSIGPDRTQNVYYWSGILLHLCNFVYWAGWISRSAGEAGYKIKVLENAKLYSYHFFLCLTLVFLFLTQIDISGAASFTAMKSIFSGEARQWKEEMEARQELLQDPQVKDVVFEPLSVYPELLYMSDVETDPDFWINLAMAEWYGKNSVALWDNSGNQ